MAGQRAWPQFRLRCPPEVKKWLDKEADRNGASLNSEILRALRERMDRDAGLGKGGDQTAGIASQA